MSISNRIILLGGILISASLLVSGCGSSTNNDQGTSFLALGFFEDPTGTIVDNGTFVPINVDIAASDPQSPLPAFVPIDKNPNEEGIQGGFIGLQNRLSNQFIRVARIDCDYEVPGAQAGFRVPSDSYLMTLVLGPGAVGEEDAESGFGLGSVGYAQFELVSTDIMAYLNANINRLPALPFRLILTCRAVGVTQAGDLMITNDVLYQVRFIESPLVTLPQTGPGAGGNLDIIGTGE